MKAWKSGKYGYIGLSDEVVESAKTHEEIKGAFWTFQKDADQIYPVGRRSLDTLASLQCRRPRSTGRRRLLQQHLQGQA